MRTLVSCVHVCCLLSLNNSASPRLCGHRHGVTCAEASVQSCGVTSITALVRISFKDHVSSNFPWRFLAVDMNHKQHECVWLSGNLLLPQPVLPHSSRNAGMEPCFSFCSFEPLQIANVCFTDACDFVTSSIILNKHSVNASVVGRRF